MAARAWGLGRRGPLLWRCRPAPAWLASASGHGCRSWLRPPSSLPLCLPRRRPMVGAVKALLCGDVKALLCGDVSCSYEACRAPSHCLRWLGRRRRGSTAVGLQSPAEGPVSALALVEARGMLRCAAACRAACVGSATSGVAGLHAGRRKRTLCCGPLALVLPVCIAGRCVAGSLLPECHAAMPCRLVLRGPFCAQALLDARAERMGTRGACCAPHCVAGVQLREDFASTAVWGRCLHL